MNRRNKFFTGLVAAAITYGALMAFVGPRHAYYGHRHFRDHEGPHPCHHACEKAPEQQPAPQQQGQ